MAEEKDFKVNKISANTVELYTDSIDVANRSNRNKNYEASSYSTQDEIFTLLNNATSDSYDAIKFSNKIYATNAIYKKVIDYYATLFLPRYYVTPRLIKGKEKTAEKWATIYNLMVDLTDGLNFETKIPTLLISLFKQGGVYFTTYYSKNTDAIDTLILPQKFCKRVGETELGTDVIKFNYSYFDNLGLTNEELVELLKSFPKEFNKGYNTYKKDGKEKWQVLDPRFSSCVLLNEKCVPTYLNAYAAILNYQAYSQNELDRNVEQLATIVEHHIPTYEDKLILDDAEMNVIHKKLSNIVKTVKNTRLVTTIGEVSVKPLLTSTDVNNETLAKAYKSIFDYVGLNESLFTGNNQYSLAASKANDRAIVWYYIEKFTNFYNVAINNLMDFKGYQLEITMLPIPNDGAETVIASYRENAKVGVGIVPFVVASGIKQKNIDSVLTMEDNLDLANRLKPLQSSNTLSGNQPNQDNQNTDNVGDKKNGKDNN